MLCARVNLCWILGFNKIFPSESVQIIRGLFISCFANSTRVCFLELPIAPEYGEKQILFEHKGGVLSCNLGKFVSIITILVSQ